jgi:hypothetical protein
MINWESSSRNWVIAKISEKTACEAAREERPAHNMASSLKSIRVRQKVGLGISLCV